jgi:hypothetical protein
MTLRDRLLYHHAYPAKLVVDTVCAAAAAWLLWQQHLLRGAAVGLIPPAVASLIVLRLVDLERVRQSRIGAYIGRHMSLRLHATAVAGVVICWIAAWYQDAYYVLVGTLVTTFAWVRGPLHESGRRAAERV